MQFLTHAAFGLFLGSSFSYLFNLDFKFIILCGVSSFIPDIDWNMQYSWNLGNVHRKILHNIWVICIISGLIYLLFRNLILVFGIATGFISHLLIDSFTVTGVYWLYPIGRKSRKYHLRGPFSMSKMKAYKIEKCLQIIFFSLAGLLFLIRYIHIEDIFTFESLVIIFVIFIVGYLLFKTIGEIVKQAIRKLGL